MKRPYRVLFVCMGNICRSPAAQGVFQRMLEDEGLGDVVQCDSAGTIDYHTGEPPDRRMHDAARERGYDLTSRARQIQSEDLDQFHLVVCMDDENYEYVTQLASSRSHRARVRRFCEFVTDCDAVEVPDPYYGGPDGFDEVMDIIEDGCSNLLEHARRKAGADAKVG